jgi:hypothetical protein
MFFRRIKRKTYLSLSSLQQHLLKPFSSASHKCLLLFRPFFFYWTRDCPQLALDPLAKKKINRSSFFSFFFSLPFFGVVCHTSDPSQGFYFEAMAAHDKLAQKDSVAILSRQLLFIYCSRLCLHTHSLFFGRETKEGQYIGHLLFLPQWRERDRHTPLIRVIRAPPSLSVWIL